jgi:hypothetical protein
MVDEALAARYAHILAEICPSFLHYEAAERRGLSTPFLVNGPKDPTARRIMVIGREYGAKGWKVEPEADGVSAYVAAALAKHRKVFDAFLAQDKKGPGVTFPNFLRELAEGLGTGDGLIYSNLLCIDSGGKAPTKSKHFPEIEGLSKRLLDAQIDHFKPDAIIFANGTSAEQVRIRRRFFPVKGKGRVFVSRRNWEDVGIPKGQLEEFELYGKFVCYRIQHPSNWRGEAAAEAVKARRHLLKVLTQPRKQIVVVSAAGVSASARAPCEL